MESYEEHASRTIQKICREVEAKYGATAVRIYHMIGKFEEAINANLKAIQLGAQEPDVYNNMGLTYKNQGNYEKAAEAYRMALKLDPDFQKAIQNLAALTEDEFSLNSVFSEKKLY